MGVQFGVVAVILDGHPYQVATFRREGPYLDGRRPSFVEYGGAADDVCRRDFTINALLYDPLSGEILDHVGGRADLARRCVRTVGPPAERFAEDRLRLLRAVRLAAELRFTLEPETRAALESLAPTITCVSAERIRDELVRLLVAADRADGVRLLDTTGLLGVIVPEVAALARLPAPQAERPAPDALAYTCRVLEHLRRPTPVLSVAALLSHLPDAGTVDEVCRRLRFSTAERRAVLVLAREVRRFSRQPDLPAAEARRLLRRGAAADLLELLRANLQAAGGDLAVYIGAAASLAAQAGSASRPDRLLTGDDLIAMGYVPGPAFTVMLRALEEARARGEIGTTQAARAWVRARFPAGAAPHPVEPRAGNGPVREDGGCDD